MSSTTDTTGESFYDHKNWSQMGFTERVDFTCHQYIDNGMNTPVVAHLPLCR